MTELRYNPLLGDWTMVATRRQNRPNMPKGGCPFCPGSGKVPEHFDVLKYDNDFPALMPKSWIFPASKARVEARVRSFSWITWSKRL